MASTIEPNVSTPCVQYSEMSARWPLIEDLRGGTLAMRDANTTWLPKEESEDPIYYARRLAMSILFEGYTDAVRKIVAKPFSKPVTVRGTESLDDRLVEIEDDTDLSGQNISQFAAQMLQTGIDYGIGHFMVEYPRLTGNETREEERGLRVRPYFVNVSPSDLIGWRFTRAPNGKNELSQIRIVENRIEPVGDYGDRVVKYVRVWTPTTWELHRQKDGTQGARIEDWELVDAGEHTFGGIPLVTYYLNQRGLMVAHPALESIAWLNLAHWQSSSDHRNYLRFARFGVMAFIGMSVEEVASIKSLGPGGRISIGDVQGDAKIVEHQGKAAEIGRNDLQDLEERMALLGIQPFVRQASGTPTATGRAIDEMRSTTEIQSWIRSLESALELGYWYAARWIGAEDQIPDDFSVDIFNEFSLSLKADADIDKLLKARIAREISHRTFLEEIKRRGLLSELTDLDLEVSAVEDEVSSMVGGVFGDEPPDGEEPEEQAEDGAGSET